jgi:hypothetical protein
MRQRLQPSAESSQVGPASHSLHQPAGPSPALADTWLQHPHSAEAQHWRQELETWLATCPGDWLSQLYAVRLADGLPSDDGIGPAAPAFANSPDPDRPLRHPPQQGRAALLRRMWRVHCSGSGERLLAAENGVKLPAEP